MLISGFCHERMNEFIYIYMKHLPGTLEVSPLVISAPHPTATTTVITASTTSVAASSHYCLLGFGISLS